MRKREGGGGGGDGGLIVRRRFWSWAFQVGLRWECARLGRGMRVSCFESLDG